MARGIQRGDILKGRYEIQRQIGKGGMSRVFMAADLQLNNKLWAIKEVDRHATDPAGRPIEQALAKEAQILSKLDHPKIVSIVDTETTDDFIYVVMDYVEGESLDRVVRREGAQSEEDVQRWMLEICDVLGYLHSQDPPIVYRDMKPNNIMLHPDGYVKLIDFGVVREYKDEADIRQDTIAFGTQGYAPPEQYGKAQTDARADIYAAGATMWHLLAGEAPSMEFPLRNVREKNPSVGEGFADVIIPKCTALERGARYQSCDELASDLEIYEELTREFRNRQVSRVRAFGISAVLAVVLVVAGFGLLAARDSTISEKYDSYLALGSDMMQNDPASAEEQYLEAIEKKPDGIDAYEGLIASYKVDGAFTDEEKKQFDNVYQKNLDVLQGSSRFSELSYEIGRLYWTYYAGDAKGDAGDNQATRIKYSSEYFKNAVSDPNFENYDRAAVYNGIAQFTSSISNLVAEGGDDAEVYRAYWDDLADLSARVSSESNEMVKLDTCALIANGMETYMDKFKNVAGVTSSEVESVYKNVERELQNMTTTDEKYETQRKETLSRLQNEVRRKMTTVYSNASVGY